VKPFGREAMLLCTRRTRDLAVRHVADEQVAERTLGRAFHGRPSLPSHEFLSRERVQPLLARWVVDPGKYYRGLQPEHPTEDGCILQERLLVRRKAVDAGSDQALNILRKILGTATL
jgi:hypothetical protein